ncbi:MAG: hypothetical protein Q7T01_01280 [bacterium]|nr:hypothetical protein [bacterium]
MKVSYSYKKVGEFDQHFCRQYFVVKAKTIERALLRLPAGTEEPLLTFRAERFAKKKAFKVSLTLTVDTYKWLAEEDDHTLREAIDLAKDKLVLQMRKRHRVAGTMQGMHAGASARRVSEEAVAS